MKRPQNLKKNLCFYSITSKQAGEFFRFLCPFQKSWTQNWKLRYLHLNKKLPQFYFRFWMNSWVVKKNYAKTFFCEEQKNSQSAKHEIYNLMCFTRKNCRISKHVFVMNKHWSRLYWNTLEHISVHHTLGVLAHNVQRLQITDLRPKTTHGAWGLSFCNRIKIDVARKRPW